MFKGSWKTTLSGIFALIVSALVFAGVFSPDDATVANAAVVSLIENVGAIIASVIGVIGLFARDNNVSSRKAGAE